MATLASLASDVYTITSRPDLTGETRISLRKAIYKFHTADTFKRDLTQVSLDLSAYSPVAANTNVWNVPLADFPRFRRPSTLITPLGYQPIVEIKEITSHDLFDLYKFPRINYFYIAGSVMTIGLQCPNTSFSFTYYQYPGVPTDPDVDIESWICDQYPDAVIEEACSAVFKMIGKDDEASRYQAIFAENIGILRMTDIGEQT